MTTKSKRVVLQVGEYAVEREEYWGFRCQATSVSWNVLKGGQQVTTCMRLKDAKREAMRRFAMEADLNAIDQYLRTVASEA